MRCLKFILLFLALSASAAASDRVTTVLLSRPEGPRKVLVYAPPPRGSGPRPLVILLHGHGGSAAQVLGEERSAAPLSVWRAIADREGLIVAAPDGAKGRDGRRGWNDGREDAANNPQTDDVALVSALIDEEVAVRHADPHRVYVMGMSNGGIMTLRLAVDLNRRLAAVAAVCASMAARTDTPEPNQPLSVMVIAGTADPLVPYGGGDVHFYGSSRGAVVGVETLMAWWRHADHLDGAPAQVAAWPHRLAGDPTRATRMLWGGDPKGFQVELVRIDGGGHIEPSMSQRYRRFYTRVVGRQNGDSEAAGEAWAFFRGKTRP